MNLADNRINLRSTRLAANKEEPKTLAATRNLLLPKFMSGNIRLREAEKAVEAVA